MKIALPAASPPTLRFAEKREQILDGAARLFNRRGIRAGTLAEVAAAVDLVTNSLTYYYRKKDDLVCACLLRSIEALRALIDQAAAAAPPGDLAGRVRALLRGYFALMAAIEQGAHPALIYFGDMRALQRPQADAAFAAYEAMFRQLRQLLHEGATAAGQALPAGGSVQRQALNARCHGLLSQLLWARAWLYRYESADYARLAEVLADLLLMGLPAAGQHWPMLAMMPVAGLATMDSAAAETEAPRETYLRTATRLVNDHGVGGASVERIAAQLALTKGSFYHHHETKEGLIDACFERSFGLIRQSQRLALAGAGNAWQRLLAATLPVVALQTAPQGPLLRLTAWTELPGALRWQKFNSLNRLSERYAAMLVDGMIDGSIRLLDPAVAAHLISGMINALAEVEHWLPGEQSPDLQALLARPMLLGLLAPEALPAVPLIPPIPTSDSRRSA